MACCWNGNCPVFYPYNPIVPSTSVTYPSATEADINTDDFLANDPSQFFILQLNQALLADSRAVHIVAGTTNYPLMDKFGNTVHSEQLAKLVALRASKCPGGRCRARANEFTVRIGHDPNRFILLCDLPCFTYSTYVATAPDTEAAG